MSVQLIVYPQNYNGSYNEISSSSTEFIVNGFNFNGLDTTPTYTSSTTGDVVLDVLTSAPPIIINSWYRFRTDASGTPAYPLSSAGNLILDSVTTLTFSGVYQKLSNLVIGQQYTITINLVTTGTGQIFTKLANGTLVYVGSLTSASSSQITETFTAQSTTDTVIISYFNNVVDSISIGDISVQPVVGAVPSGAVQLLEDGQVICDLYEDEDLPLTLSVDDFKNVAEKVQSYSKAFNLPSTKRNNQIFNAIFEITRAYDRIIFNPYKRTKCVLKQDGFILFEGYLRMLDVTDKLGEISYNVNLYSEVVALADTLKDKTFSDIDFLELDHQYNDTQIKNSWNNAGTGISYTYANTSGFRDAYTTLKYPFVDWNHQFTLSGTNINYSSITDIFRPFINIKYLIDRIFQDVPFTYESDFFDTEDFKKLYMDFNWGADDIPISSNPLGIFANAINTPTGVFAGTSFTPLEIDDIPSSIFPSAPPDYNFTTHILTNTVLNAAYGITYTFEVKNTDTVNRTVELQWLAAGVPFDYTGSITLIPNQTYTFTGTIQIPPLAVGETVQPQFKASTAGVIQQKDTGLIWSLTVSNFISMLNSLRGETGQWDFLKGLITMFNLVTLPDEDNPNNIKIEPYSDVFINNTNEPLNWTDKIDISQMKLTPLTDLNKKTIFKFVEDEDDYAFNVYKRAANHLYGSKKYDAFEFTILAGEDEIIAEPFAATVVKPLDDDFPDFITPALYAYNADDGTSEGFENSPRIMYNNGVKTIAGYKYNAPLPNGSTAIGNETEFLQFSHLTDIPTVQATPLVPGSRDFHFGECQLIQPVGSTVNDNLFNLYWLPYYSELYNPDTRIMTIKVNLSPADINTFKFNDTVYLKNRVFRVNKIDYKPNDLATVEFILIP